MKILIPLILLFLVSCDNLGPSKKSETKLPGLPETVKLGESSEKELNEALGEPKDSYVVKDATINNYPDGVAVKIENDVAKSYFRDPSDKEINLQYWLQLWKDQQIVNEKIESTKDAHGKFEYQLINQSEKTTVIYDQESGVVKRVVHFEN